MAKTRIPNMKISAKMDADKQQFRKTLLVVAAIALTVFIVLTLFGK